MQVLPSARPFWTSRCRPPFGSLLFWLLLLADLLRVLVDFVFGLLLVFLPGGRRVIGIVMLVLVALLALVEALVYP